jgi:hypothetical protein
MNPAVIQHAAQAPVAESQAISAIVTPIDVLGEEAQVAGARSLPLAESGERGETPAIPPPVRRGSPFADGGVRLAAADAVQQTPIQSIPYVPPPLPAYQPSHPAAVGGAIASVMLGAMSLLIGWFTAWALVTCIVGVAMGVWGVYSRKRATAMIGICLCCAALLLTGVAAAVRLYKQLNNGAGPFESVEQPLETLE